MDFLIHPCRWIDDEENVCTPPKLGRYWEIHPLRPQDFPIPPFFFMEHRYNHHACNKTWKGTLDQNVRTGQQSMRIYASKIWSQDNQQQASPLWRKLSRWRSQLKLMLTVVTTTIVRPIHRPEEAVPSGQGLVANTMAALSATSCNQLRLKCTSNLQAGAPAA